MPHRCGAPPGAPFRFRRERLAKPSGKSAKLAHDPGTMTDSDSRRGLRGTNCASGITGGELDRFRTGANRQECGRRMLDGL
jgi:hypothetical protein